MQMLPYVTTYVFVLGSDFLMVEINPLGAEGVLYILVANKPISKTSYFSNLFEKKFGMFLVAFYKIENVGI
jgi:hypothetical protein